MYFSFNSRTIITRNKAFALWQQVWICCFGSWQREPNTWAKQVFKAEWLTHLKATSGTELTGLHLGSVIGAELCETGWGQVSLAFICHPVFLQKQSCGCGCFSSTAHSVGVKSSFFCFLLLLQLQHYLLQFIFFFFFLHCVDLVLLSLELNLKRKRWLCCFLDGLWLRMWWRLTQLEDFQSQLALSELLQIWFQSVFWLWLELCGFLRSSKSDMIYCFLEWIAPQCIAFHKKAKNSNLQWNISSTRMRSCLCSDGGWTEIKSSL